KLERGAIGGLKALDGCSEVLTRHLERFGFLRRPAIEAAAIIAQRGIAFRGHARAYLSNISALLRELRQIQPPSRQGRADPRTHVESLNRHPPQPREGAPPSPAPHPCGS